MAVVPQMNPISNVGIIRLFRPVVVSVERQDDNQSQNDDAKDAEEPLCVVTKVATVIVRRRGYVCRPVSYDTYSRDYD